MVSSRKLRLMGRRRFLENLGMIGLSGTTIQHLDKDKLLELTDDPEEEVPRLKTLRHTNREEVIAGEAPPDREPEYYTIPREQWLQTEGAIDAANRLEAHYENQGIYNTAVGIKRRQNGDPIVTATYIESSQDGESEYELHHTASKQVSEADFEEFEEETPSSVSGTVGTQSRAKEVGGFPVQTERSSMEFYSYYDNEYRPVPAGCAIEVDVNYGGVTNPGTIGVPAYDGRDQVVTTAGHVAVVGDSDAEQPEKPWWGDNEIGKVSEAEYPQYVANFDGGVIELDDDTDHVPERALDNGDATTGYLSGVAAWDYISDIADTGDSPELTHQGQTTGTANGEITEIKSAASKTFVADIEGQDGDSGGPLYRSEPGRLGYTVYGSVNGGAEDGNKTIYTAFIEMENKFDIMI